MWIFAGTLGNPAGGRATRGRRTRRVRAMGRGSRRNALARPESGPLHTLLQRRRHGDSRSALVEGEHWSESSSSHEPAGIDLHGSVCAECPLPWRVVCPPPEVEPANPPRDRVALWLGGPRRGRDAGSLGFSRSPSLLLR